MIVPASPMYMSSSVILHSYTLYVISLYITDCQFTCHQKCGPLVRLGCKCKSPTDGAAEGTDPLSAETSLSDFDSSSTLSPDGSSEPTNVSFVFI